MPTCDGSCGSGNWSADRRRAWSEDHGGSREARVLAPPRVQAQIPRRRAGAEAETELMARAASPELQRRVLSRWRGPQPRASVGPDGLVGLRDRQALHLGESRRLGTLVAVLPVGASPITRPDAVLEAVAPEAGGCGCMAAAEARTRQVGPRVPGLFWDGMVPYHAGAWALARAVVPSPMLRRELIVGPMPARYREQVQPDAARLIEDGQGRVRLQGAGAPLCWSCDGADHALEHGRGLAAMADYHLWWAHRLHSYVETDRGNALDLLLCRLAARRAAYYLRLLGRVLAHLRGHTEPEVGARHAA